MENLIRGFLFACTNKSEEECLANLLFATEKSYGPVVIRIREGDLLFLNNIETDTLFGVFRAVSDGSHNLKPKAFDGKYPYQVKVGPLGEKITIIQAKKLLNRFGVKRNLPLFSKKLLICLFASCLNCPTVANYIHGVSSVFKEIQKRYPPNSHVIWSST